jgi:repressor of nif and glnA expression
MTTPRNRLQWEAGQAIRAEIRQILFERNPLSHPLTAEQIGWRLSREISVRTIRWHLQQIRQGVQHTLPLRQFI